MLRQSLITKGYEIVYYVVDLAGQVGFTLYDFPVQEPGSKLDMTLYDMCIQVRYEVKKLRLSNFALNQASLIDILP